MNTNLLKLNRRNFFEHNEVNDLKLKVSNSGSTILLNNTNNDLIIELPFVDESDGLFFNFLISEVNSSKSLTFFCAKDALGIPEQKLKIKNSSGDAITSSLSISTTDSTRKWVGENMRVECNGSFWFLTALSFNESSNTNTLSNNSNFNVITATGTDELSGESNLTFNDTEVHIVEVYDNAGKLISRMDKQKIASSLDIEKYAAGTYTIKVMPEGITYQIVKQ